MKKYILSFAMMVMGASLLTSCLNDNDNNNNQPVKIPVTTGLYDRTLCGEQWTVEQEQR